MHNENDSAVGFIRASVLPDRCVFCDTAIEYRRKVCKSCMNSVKMFTGKCCLLCGLPSEICCCDEKAVFYSAMTAVYRYDGVVRKGIHNWKFSDMSHSTRFFAERLSERIRETFRDGDFDFITFVPQTQAETEEKGFNQSEKLARAVGNELKIPVRKNLVKVYETERQHLLPLGDKRGNTFGVFDCINTENIKNKKILLIDDVKTSGSTINECAKMLMLYDAESVHCAVIAATVRRRKKGEK